MSVTRASRPSGAGILLAATSVGGSHLLLAPEAGARFGYGLLWVVLLAHLVKYPAFEFGSRYALATGESLLDAYARARGPKGWALWLGLIDMLLESIGVLAAITGLTASLLQAWFGGGLLMWSAVVAGSGVVLVLTGSARRLSRVCFSMMAVLALGTAAAFVAAPPSPSGVVQSLAPPRWPSGADWLIAAVLGWMPTGLGVSIWQSLWIVAQPVKTSMRSEERVRLGLRGFRGGYLTSLVLALVFLCLGASVLEPAGIEPHGEAVAIALSSMYTKSVGEWFGPVFLTTAAFALLSTVITCLDAFPRTLLETLRLLFPGRTWSSRARLSITVSYLSMAILGGGALLMAVPDPERLILWLGAVTFLISPVYYALNWLAVSRQIPDPALRPPRWLHALSAAGLLSLIWIAFRILRAPLGG
ncbi:MAG: Nramp family divalent metal transporter [Planctomycetota bacterium]